MSIERCEKHGHWDTDFYEKCPGCPCFVSVVSYGAGTNSTAMLIGLHERGERPDLILFADTGGERPETYRHRDVVSDWCASIGFPPIVTVRNEIPSRKGGLENYCLSHKTLPSIAFGFKTCSLQFKLEPVNKYLNDNGIVDSIRMVGIDAGEQHRAKYGDDDKFNQRYPLIEWDWGREECIEAIKRAGLPQPGKSACFFCPSSKPREILELKRKHPDLLKRALEMEANAELISVKGLGRSFSWAEVVKYDDDQLDMFGFPPEIACECMD